MSDSTLTREEISYLLHMLRSPESLRVLVACEFSGIVQEAFISQGHNAVTCDLRPTETEGPHYQGDVQDILYDGWDLMIAHPPCTYLTNSGVRWLHERPSRWDHMESAAAFFRTLLDAPIPHIAIENPIPHAYAIERIGATHNQTIQPWQFGHPETKRTCLWLKNLPMLRPTNIVSGREARIIDMAPSATRQAERSRFYPGIARAMAGQWSRHVLRRKHA